MKQKKKRGKYRGPEIFRRLRGPKIKKPAAKTTESNENEVNYAVEKIFSSSKELARLPLAGIRRQIPYRYKVKTRHGFFPENSGENHSSSGEETKYSVKNKETYVRIKQRGGLGYEDEPDEEIYKDSGNDSKDIKCRSREEDIRTYENEHKRIVFNKTGHAHNRKAEHETVISAAEETAQKAVKYTGNFAPTLAAAALLAFIIIVFTLVMAVLSSPYGMFLNEGDGGMLSVSDALYIINCDFQYRLEEAESEYEFDECESRGTRAPWREVLAVYAVRYFDTYGGYELSLMDDGKIGLLKDVFYDMTSFSMEIEERENEDGEYDTYLIVTFTKRTPEEMTEIYGFSDEKKQLLGQLLGDGYAQMFTSLMYGTGAAENIADMAATQIGQTGGEPYWSWYGYTERVEWCAIFVSWCADCCGYLEDGTVPKFENCQAGRKMFEDMGVLHQQYEEPEKGWIVFFDWEGDGISDHVGIVESCENGFVYTIEGNSGDMCRQKSYPVGSELICAYASPGYG